VKFSVRDISSLSTSPYIDICLACWESANLGVEYLFVDNGSRKGRSFTEGNHDFRYASINLL